MKDIVLKNRKTTNTTTVMVDREKSTTEKKWLVSAIEKSIDIASRYSNSLYQILAKTQPEIVTQQNGSVIISEAFLPKRKKTERRVLNKSVKTERRSGERRKKLGDAVKNTANKAHGSAKTPIGKLAIVQAIAVLALFAYASTTKKTALSYAEQYQSNLATKNMGEAVKNGPIQKYLPSVPQYSEPKAFEETTVAKQGNTPPIHTWLTPWNLAELQENVNLYSSVSAFWLTLQSDGIHVQPKLDWSKWQDFAKKPHKATQKRFVTVSADPNYSFLALSSPEAQTKHIAELLSVVQAQGFDGVDIDYEGLGSENKNLYTEFIRNLTNAFHSNQKQVAVTVEARINNQVPMDWYTLGKTVDEVRVMVYDYHSKNTGTPGPVSPLGWLKEVLDYAGQTIDSKKVVIGLGNYGYDWAKTTSDTNQVSWEGTGISFDQALALAHDRQAPLVRSTGIDERGYDVGSIPNFNYKDSDGKEHSVWFEDKQSLDAKVNLVSQYKTNGIIFWSVGLGDKKFWETKNSL